MEKKHKFKVGDKVIYTNAYGVCFGEKTIIKLATRSNMPTYYIEPTDTPWFSFHESAFEKIGAK